MRIIGGTHRSRKISAPLRLHLRPTTDFAKESLFNILEHRFDLAEVTVLDLFSGTGAISFEFASRGAKKIISVEKNASCAAFIRQRSREFGFETIETVKADAFRFVQTCGEKFDIVFADPPYGLPGTEKLSGLVFSTGLLNDNGLFILEHGARAGFSEEEHFLEKRSYGEVNFSIFG